VTRPQGRCRHHRLRKGYCWPIPLCEPGLERCRGPGEWDGVGAFNDYEQQLGPAAFGKLRWTRGALKYEAGLRFGLNEPLSQPLYVA
jgi:hypothetical protein